MKRALLLAVLLMLAGCGSWPRPRWPAYYSCTNSDVHFVVHYTWDPLVAHLIVDDAAPLALPLLEGMQDRRPGYYAFGSAEGVRLAIAPRGAAYLNRPGERPLICRRERTYREGVVVT